MGVSKKHASTVALVRNLQTGRISPQFHVIYDDDFETGRSDEYTQPLVWEELLTFNTFKSDYGAEDNVQVLHDEWLDRDEISHREFQHDGDSNKTNHIENRHRKGDELDAGLDRNVVDTHSNKDQNNYFRDHNTYPRRSERTKRDPDRL